MKNWVEIWTEISEAFDKEPCKYHSGLCSALSCANNMKIDGHKIAAIINPKKDSQREYWWKMPPLDIDVRATFAGLMAAMGNRGFEEFFKWCKEHQ